MDTGCLDDPKYLPLYSDLISVMFAYPAEKTHLIKFDYFIRAVKLKKKKKDKGIMKYNTNWNSKFTSCPALTDDVSNNSWPAEKGLTSQTLQPVPRPAFWSRIQPRLHCKHICLPQEGTRKMGMCPANPQLSFLLCADTSAKSHLSHKRSMELISIRKSG